MADGARESEEEHGVRYKSNARFLFLTVALLVVTACGYPFPLGSSQSSGSQAEPAKPATVVFMTPPVNSLRFWQELVASFEEANPTIHVELLYQQIPDDWPEQADIILGSIFLWQELVDQGRLLDLQPLLENDALFAAADFYPGMLALYQRGQGLRGIPLGASVSVLVYNKDLFESAGIPLPTPDWTWADVWEAAGRLKSATARQEQYRNYSGLPETSQAALEWLAERSGGVYRFEGGKVMPTLDNPSMRQALANYLAFGDSIVFLAGEPPPVQTPEEILARIANGEIGLTMMSLGALEKRIARYPQLAIAPLPPGDLAAQHAIDPWFGLFISAGTAYPQAAWRWLRFVSQQNLGVSQWGILAARQSVAHIDKTWPQMPPDAEQVLYASLKNQADHLRSDPVIDAAYEALSEALASVQIGGVDVGTALAKAQQQVMAESQARQKQQELAKPTPFHVKPPPIQGEISVQFQVMTSEQLYRTVSEEFEQEHPGWHVQVISQGPDSSGGCVAGYVDGSSLTAAFTQAWLAEITPLFQVDPRLSEEDFFPQAITATTWQGKLYAMPASIKPLVLSYNPDIFQELRLEAPGATLRQALRQAQEGPQGKLWTVEDILQAAEKIDLADQGYFGYLPQPQEVPFLLEQQGIPLFTNDRPPRPRFVEPDVLQAVTRLRRLGTDQGSAPTPADADLLRRSGRVAMWFNLFGSRPGEEQIAGVDVTPIRLQPGTALPVQLGVLGLVKDAKQPQACWEWINFLVQQGVRPDDELPALRRLAESEATRAGPDQGLYQAYLEALRRAETAPAHSPIVADWAGWWFTEALRADGNNDLATVLQPAQDKAEAFVACLGPAGDQDLEQAQSCARQADPEHPLAHLGP